MQPQTGFVPVKSPGDCTLQHSLPEATRPGSAGVCMQLDALRGVVPRRGCLSVGHPEDSFHNSPARDQFAVEQGLDLSRGTAQECCGQWPGTEWAGDRDMAKPSPLLQLPSSSATSSGNFSQENQ